MGIVYVSMASLGINLILGKIRTRFKPMTLLWWLIVHGSIPILIPLRMALDTPLIYIALFIAVAILGQYIGARCQCC